MSRPYELIFIVKPDAGEDVSRTAVQKITGVIEKAQGEIITVEEWGRRKLAYPIQKCSEGNYVYMKFSSPPTEINEIERLLKLNEQVIRYLTVKLDPSQVTQETQETSEETPQPAGEEGGSNE